MKELIGLVVGIVGLLFCVGGALNAFSGGHYIYAGLWIIGVIGSFSLANESLESVDDGGGPEML